MPADRPIQHNGNVAEYLRQMGVKNVTAQDVDPLISSSLIVADASRVGPAFAEKTRAYEFTITAVAGQHGCVVVNSAAGGSYIDSIRNFSVGAMIWSLERDENVASIIQAGAASLDAQWSTGFIERQVDPPNIQLARILTANLPNGGQSTIGTATIFPTYPLPTAPLLIPPGYAFLGWNFTVNQNTVVGLIARDV